jgi:anaerobic selenocysteine-containing dehydrogenase
MCACRCGIRVPVRDGEIRYIDGNQEHPIGRGDFVAPTPPLGWRFLTQSRS